MRILLVEEEVQTAQYLRKGLVENGFAVDVVRLDSGGFSPPNRTEYDLLVCDVPPGTGRLSEIPWGVQQAPVLFLADRNRLPQRAAVGPGAENYLLKPFAFSDFLARVRGLLRWRADRDQ